VAAQAHCVVCAERRLGGLLPTAGLLQPACSRWPGPVRARRHARRALEAAPQVGSIIQGHLEGGLLYTQAHVRNIKAQLRGALRAVAGPVAMPSVTKELSLRGVGSGGATGMVGTEAWQPPASRLAAARRPGPRRPIPPMPLAPHQAARREAAPAARGPCGKGAAAAGGGGDWPPGLGVLSASHARRAAAAGGDADGGAGVGGRAGGHAEERRQLDARLLRQRAAGGGHELLQPERLGGIRDGALAPLPETGSARTDRVWVRPPAGAAAAGARAARGRPLCAPASPGSPPPSAQAAAGGVPQVRRCGIPNERAFLRSKYPEGVALDSAYVSAGLLDQVETAVEEAVAGAGGGARAGPG
jgi:hypothetical protein